MTEAVPPRKVMGLSFPTEEERVCVALGRCRDQANIAAASAVILSMRTDGSTDAHVERMLAASRAYRAALADALTDEIETRFQHDCAADFATARAFGNVLAGLEADMQGLSRATAEEILRNVGDAVLPALFHLTDCVLIQAATDQNAVLDRVQQRNEKLEDLFARMEVVSRMVYMISINAAVEAARTGGDAGRAFAVIASEVRNLARAAADLVEQGRHSIDG